MYADRKGWPVSSIEVGLNHDKIHAKDCEDCESDDVWIDEIHSVIHIEGDLDEAQHQRMLEIATRCPVHRSLTTEPKIRTVAG